MVHNVGCRSSVGYGVCLAHPKPHLKACTTKNNIMYHKHTFGSFKMFDSGTQCFPNEKLLYMVLVSCYVLGYAFAS